MADRAKMLSGLRLISSILGHLLMTGLVYFLQLISSTHFSCFDTDAILVIIVIVLNK